MTTYLCGNSHIVALAKADGTASDLTVFPLGNGKHERWKTFSRRVGDGVAFVPDQYAENVEHYTGSPVITPGATWGFLNVNHNAGSTPTRCGGSFGPRSSRPSTV